MCFPPISAGRCSQDAIRCDLRSDLDVTQLFEQHRFSAVVHLAAATNGLSLRSSDWRRGEPFRNDALAEGGSKFWVPRFVFGSSASVYGNSARTPCTEIMDPSPDEPYGVSKLAIEKILEQLSAASSVETVSLRIARVLGGGAKNTSSPWSLNNLLQTRMT
jgi:UDP-glucose 4-epimerase